MLISLSHANHVESCHIGVEDYLVIKRILERDGEITFANYTDIGGYVTVSLSELSRRIRFREDGYDESILTAYSKDVNLLYGLLEEMEWMM